MSQVRAGDTPLLSQFAEGNVVILQSLCAGGQNLTVVDGEIERQKGREDRQAQFRVHVHRPGVIALQNVYNSDWWLAIYERKPLGSGRGGPYCEFYVKDIDGKVVALESVKYPGCNLGVEPDGSGTETHCLFVPYLYSVAPTHPPQPIHHERLVQQPSTLQPYSGYPQPAPVPQEPRKTQQPYPGYLPPAPVPQQPRVSQLHYPSYQPPAPVPQQPRVSQLHYPSYQPPAPVPQQPRVSQPHYPSYQPTASVPQQLGASRRPYPGYQQPAPLPQQPGPSQQHYPGYQQPAPLPQQPGPSQQHYPGYRQPAPVLQQPGSSQHPYPGYPQPPRQPRMPYPGYPKQHYPMQGIPPPPHYFVPSIPSQPSYPATGIPPQQHPNYPHHPTSSVSPLQQPSHPTATSTAPFEPPSTPPHPLPNISSLQVTEPPSTPDTIPRTPPPTSPHTATCTPPQEVTSPTSPCRATLTRTERPPSLQKQVSSPLPVASQPPPETSPQSQEPDNELLRETWYHAGISREGAEELLKKTTNGHFLVRESETMRGGVLSLSLKHPGGVKHFRILKNKSGLYEIPGNPSFKTVPELINYFTQHSITVDPNHRLRYPCAQPSATHEDVDAPTSHGRRHTIGTLPRQPAEPPPAPEENQPTAAPLGYNILDLFQPGNILRLIPRADPSNLPIWVGSKKLHGKGTYHSSNSEFQVVVPSHGLVMLKNVHSLSCHLCIDKKAHIKADGKDGDDACCFVVFMTEDGNSVLLESQKFPGWNIAMGIGGEVADPKTIGPSSREAHFGVRAEKVVSPHSSKLTTPFGGYSIANQLKDHCTIQLFCKRVGGYLSINKKSSVEECRDENDQQTFFILHDHGMGIFSLHSYKYPGHLIRVHKNTLEGKGDADMSADFRLKETPNGAACFESITCPGMCISIRSSGTQIQGCHFSISLLTIQQRGKVETITKKPLSDP